MIVASGGIVTCGFEDHFSRTFHHAAFQDRVREIESRAHKGPAWVELLAYQAFLRYEDLIGAGR